MAAPNAPIPPTASGIPDWINWIAIIATLFGFVTSIVGLIATYMQAKAAKEASLGAKGAAMEAVSALKNRNTLITIASTIAQINLIKQYINSDQILAAKVGFTSCSGNIREIFYNLGIKEFMNSSGYSDGIDIVVKELTASFDLPNMSVAKKASVIKHLNEISARMSAEDAKNRWST